LEERGGDGAVAKALEDKALHKGDGSSLFSVEYQEIFGAVLLVFQSQRELSFQPRVARNELPWVKTERNHNPARVESVS
jgi:hypothetical protein